MAGRLGFKIVSALQTHSSLTNNKIYTRQQYQYSGGALPSLSLSRSRSHSHTRGGEWGLGGTATAPHLDDDGDMVIGSEDGGQMNSEPDLSPRARKLSSREINTSARHLKFITNESKSQDAFSSRTNLRYDKYEEEDALSRHRVAENERFHTRRMLPLDEDDRYHSSYQDSSQDEEQSFKPERREEEYNPKTVETDKQQLEEDEYFSDWDEDEQQKEEEKAEAEKQQEAKLAASNAQRYERPSWWSQVRAFKEEKVVIKMPDKDELANMKTKPTEEPATEICKFVKLEPIFIQSQTAADRQLKTMKSKMDEERNKHLRYTSMSGRDWVQYMARKREGLVVNPASKLKDPQRSWMDPPIKYLMDGLEPGDSVIEPIEYRDVSEPVKNTQSTAEAPGVKKNSSVLDVLPCAKKMNYSDYSYDYTVDKASCFAKSEGQRQPSSAVRAAATVRANRCFDSTGRFANYVSEAARYTPIRKRQRAFSTLHRTRSVTNLKD